MSLTPTKDEKFEDEVCRDIKNIIDKVMRKMQREDQTNKLVSTCSFCHSTQEHLEQISVKDVKALYYLCTGCWYCWSVKEYPRFDEGSI